MAESAISVLVKNALGMIPWNKQYESTLENLKSTIGKLVPLVEEFKRYSKIMDLDTEEIEKLTAMMEAAQELIHKCPKIRWWNCFLIPYYRNKLEEAEKSHVKYVLVKLQKEILVQLQKEISSNLERIAWDLKSISVPANKLAKLSLLEKLNPDDTASCSQSSNQYDVFISYTGEVRRNFASYLYAALSNDEIKTFIDFKLKKGVELWPTLERTIEDSSLYLVILSENYAASTWCLDELIKMLECSKRQGTGHPVLPVFYIIKPKHVRWQTGSYKRAISKHEKRYPEKQIRKWRDALTAVANRSGWDSHDYRFDSDLIKDIVEDVKEKLSTLRQG